MSSGFLAMFTGSGSDTPTANSASASRHGAIAGAPVVILAGGTGGHIFPGIAVAQALRSRGVPVTWLGSDGGLEAQLVPSAGIELHTLPVRGVRGKSFAARLAAPFRVLRAIAAAWRLFGASKPRSAIAFGGFAAGPGGIAAWLRGVTLIVHEQNRVAGVTNRILSHFAKKRLCGFSGALAGAEWIGNPVRAAIASLPPPRERYEMRSDRLRVLVLGGSQGAYGLNTILPEVLQRVPAATRPQVRHQSGRRHLDTTSLVYSTAGIEAQVEPFIDDMAAAYAWADLVICRAGALTLAELCAAGVASVLVPFPAAVDDHQTRNAAVLVDAGTARLVAEGEDFAGRLGAALNELLAGDIPAVRARLCSMAEAARALAKPDAAERIADLCIEAGA